MPARFISLYRLVFGIVVFLALAIQFYASCIVSHFNAVSFFSYFTVISNLLAGGMLIYLSLERKKPQPKYINNLRGAITVYMAITGIVYWGVLHRFLESTVSWVNLYAHGVMPIVVFLDWIISPPKSLLSFKDIKLWIVFPLLYLAYTMIRGSLINWYPYPFLVPSPVHGYGGVFLSSAGILITMAIVSGVLIFLSNTQQRRYKK